MARLIFTSKNSNSNFSVSVSSYVAGKFDSLEVKFVMYKLFWLEFFIVQTGIFTAFYAIIHVCVILH